MLTREDVGIFREVDIHWWWKNPTAYLLKINFKT